MTFDGRHPLAEDDLWRKTTLDRRHPLTEDDLWQKTTFDERRPLTEDDLWQKTTFDGRRHSSEDDLWQKTTFVDENLWEKTTKSGRRTLAEDDLLQKTTLAHTPHHIPLCGIFLFFFHQRWLLSKVVFCQRLSSVKGHLPSKVVFLDNISQIFILGSHFGLS